jgi:glycosyltransferase involved in cell wall biosynthesis
MKEIILSIFVPCHNEEDNIANALNNIKDAVKNITYEVLVVDDNSKDKTVNVVENFIKNNPELSIKLFVNKNNLGIGYNYFFAADKALGKYYMLVNGDADFPSQTIKKITDNINKADMIISYFPGNNDKRTVVRKFFSKLFVSILNTITFNKLKYYNGPTLHLLKNVKLHKSSTFHFSYQAELIANLLMLKKSYIEVEVESVDNGSMDTVVTLHNIYYLGKSIFSIFLKQIVYLIKKILK